MAQIVKNLPKKKKESAFNAGDPDPLPGSGSSHGEENGNTLCILALDRGAWPGYNSWSRKESNTTEVTQQADIINIFPPFS